MCVETKCDDDDDDDDVLDQRHNVSQLSTCVMMMMMMMMMMCCLRQTSEPTTDLCALTEDWFSRLSSSSDESVAAVLNIAQQPFSELRLPALRLVATLAALPWAQQLLVAHPGFVEYLLDRGTERGERAGLEAKYRIVLTLVESDVASTSVAAELYQRLREYAREGPLYVRVETQVAFETGQ